MILILMASLSLSLMKVFLVFIQQTLVRIFPFSTKGCLASTGLDRQNLDETTVLSIRKQTVDNVQVKDQGFMEGDSGFDHMQV